MLYFVFTIDGDWDEYFNTKLPDEKRKPDKKTLLKLIDRQIKLAKVINGKQLHFVHTSPLVRDFFIQPEFIAKWKELKTKGGSVGVHCHEEDIYTAWYFDDQTRMDVAISYLANGLRREGISTVSYRGGFLAFGPKVIPILEKNNLCLDFSCEPDRHLKYGDVLVSDWRGAPDVNYHMSYEDHRKPGNSHVFEIPMGVYIERMSLWQIWQKARKLKKEKQDQILTVLAHTYDYTSFKMRLKLKLALLILKRYGKFVNAEEVLEKIEEN